MNKDSLFLLAPGFSDNERQEYCPECAEVWGLLSYFPTIKESVDICYQPISRPRTDLIELLGQENQNCPTLILSDSSPNLERCGIRLYNGLRFIDNARDMGLYYAQRFSLPAPRGHRRSS